MTTYTITCKCGERFHFDAGQLGREIRCWRCNRRLRTSRPRPREVTTSREVRPKQPWRFQLPSMRTVARATRRVVLGSLPFGRRWQGPLAATLAVACWGLLGTMLLVTLLMWRYGDRVSLATILLFVGRWIYLVPLGGMALLVLRRQRSLLLPLGIAALVTLFPVMGLSTGWRRLLPDPEGTPLRVVTFNTAERETVTDSLTSLLDLWRPDVVAFQECSVSLAARMATLEGWHVHVARPLCLMSRFPITAAQQMDRASLERVRTEGPGELGGAGFVVRYVLATPAGPVGFTNLHLETARKGLEGLLTFDVRWLGDNSEIRDIEAERARAWVDGGMVPTIVAGDFNAPREGRNFTDHWADLHNAFSEVGVGFGATRFNGWIRIRIDHVLYGMGLRAVRAWVAPDAWSDHRPLVVDLRRLPRVMD